MDKITNQYMVPDLPDNKAGFECKVCSEKFIFNMPINSRDFKKIATAFDTLHTIKGCNKIEIKPTKNES